MARYIKYKIVSLLLSSLTLNGIAQQSLYVTSGSDIFINNATHVFIDSLILKPSINYIIAGLNSLNRDASAIPPPPAPYIQRVYHLLSTLTAYSGDITIYYRDAELNGLNENLLNLNLYDGTSWNLFLATARDATNNFVSTTGLSNISMNQLTLAIPAGPVPVTLTEFKIQTNNCAAKFFWTTASEQNSKHFEIQHSTDGINFVVVGIVPASGSSHLEKRYNFSSNISNPLNFFRLRMVDIDGTFKFSSTVRANTDCNTPLISMYPNPAKDVVTIRGLKTGTHLRLLNNKGQVLKSITTTNTFQNLNVSDLPAGTYIIQLIENNSIFKNLKLVKE